MDFSNRILVSMSDGTIREYLNTSDIALEGNWIGFTREYEGKEVSILINRDSVIAVSIEDMDATFTPSTSVN